ncbi:hypothetical protein FRB93_007889 [Tulasnella sp. JGI-2019a]|nr:hypothetical protein FRB93_007889 [Tulasnella sp. JGI-2019a]
MLHQNCNNKPDLETDLTKTTPTPLKLATAIRQYCERDPPSNPNMIVPNVSQDLSLEGFHVTQEQIEHAFQSYFAPKHYRDNPRNLNEINRAVEGGSGKNIELGPIKPTPKKLATAVREYCEDNPHLNSDIIVSNIFQDLTLRGFYVSREQVEDAVRAYFGPKPFVTAEQLAYTFEYCRTHPEEAHPQVVSTASRRLNVRYHVIQKIVKHYRDRKNRVGVLPYRPPTLEDVSTAQKLEVIWGQYSPSGACRLTDPSCKAALKRDKNQSLKLRVTKISEIAS